MTTEELYNITRSIPTEYYCDGESHEWDTGDPGEQDSFIDRGLVDDMYELSGAFCAYAFSNSAPAALIECLRHKLQIYVEWWNNCKDKLQESDLSKLKDFNGVCQNWLSIIDAAFPQIQPQKAGSEDGVILPKELNTEEAIILLQKAVKIGLCDDSYKWLKSKALLAYFADKASEYLGLGKGEYDGKKKVSWKPFETLFVYENLSVAKQDWIKTGTLPDGYKDVDRLFNN